MHHMHGCNPPRQTWGQWHIQVVQCHSHVTGIAWHANDNRYPTSARPQGTVSCIQESTDASTGPRTTSGLICLVTTTLLPPAAFCTRLATTRSSWLKHTPSETSDLHAETQMQVLCRVHVQTSWSKKNQKDRKEKVQYIFYKIGLCCMLASSQSSSWLANVTAQAPGVPVPI